MAYHDEDLRLPMEQMNDATAVWWNNIKSPQKDPDGVPKHICVATATMQELNRQQMPVAYACLDGRRTVGGGPDLIYSGLVHVPDDQLVCFQGELDAAAGDPKIELYLHEVAKEHFPMFIDFDLKQPITSKTLGMILAVLLAEQDSTAGAETSDLFTKHLHMRCYDGDPDTNLQEWPTALQALAREKSSAAATKWTWIAVLRLVLESHQKMPTADDVVPVTTINGAVLRPIVALFLIAISCRVHRRLMQLYPRLPARSRAREMYVLCNYRKGNGGEADADRVSFPLDDQGRCRIGMHLHLRHIIVNRDIAKTMRLEIVEDFQKAFPGHAEIAAAFDEAPYTGKSGGLRRYGSLKAEMCKACKGRHGAGCGSCGSGRISVRRYYGSLCIVYPDSRPLLNDTPSEKRVGRFFNPVYAASLCTVRVAREDGGNQPLTPHFAGDLSKAAHPTTAVVRDMLAKEREMGPTSVTNSIRTLRKRYAIHERDARLGGILEATYSLHNLLAAEPGRPPPEAHRENLLEGDPRLSRIRDFLPLLCEAVFHRGYRTLSVRSVNIIRDGKNGQPQRMIIFIAGSCDTLCFNRMIGHSAKTDIDSVPGQHTGWSGCVYFEITRNGTGTIKQRCCNRCDKPNRRHGSCARWAGALRRIPEVDHQRVRDMFYLPEQQTDPACQRLIFENIKKMNQQYRKRVLDEVGPTSTYGKFATQAMKNYQQSKKRRNSQGMVTPSTIFQDDALFDV